MLNVCEASLGAIEMMVVHQYVRAERFFASLRMTKRPLRMTKPLPRLPLTRVPL